MHARVRQETLAPVWPVQAILDLFALPFNDLLLRAQTVHRAHHPANAVQQSSLLSIKTGACPEDCAYCPQSSRYHTEVEAAPLMPLDQVLAAARQAKDAGRAALLHGRRLALSHRAPTGSGDRTRAGREGAGPGDLRHPGHAEGRPGRTPEGRRPGLLQPQPGYRAGALRRDHPHPHLPGPAGHAASRARRRPEGLLRRHRRHGGIARDPRRPDRRPGQPGPLPGIRTRQPIGQGAGHPPGRCARSGPHRVRAHHRRHPHRHAPRRGAAVGGPREHARQHPGPVLHGRRQFDLPRRAAADHAESAGADRRPAVRAPGAGPLPAHPEPARAAISPA